MSLHLHVSVLKIIHDKGSQITVSITIIFDIAANKNDAKAIKRGRKCNIEDERITKNQNQKKKLANHREIKRTVDFRYYVKTNMNPNKWTKIDKNGWYEVEKCV